MSFLELAKNRYSCKSFSGRPLEEEKLIQILEAGRLAPTAKNLQEQRIYVIRDPEGLAKVDFLTPCRYHAPTVLMVAWNKEQVYTYPGGKRTSGAEDATHRGHPHDAGRSVPRGRQLLAEPFGPRSGRRTVRTAGERSGADAAGPGLCCRGNSAAAQSQ